MFPNDINVFKITSAKSDDVSITRDRKRKTTRSCFRNLSRNLGYPGCNNALMPANDPFSPFSLIPLPSPFGIGLMDSSCFRRRNERERERVRCVNEGYIRLKEHLPIDNKEKRLSKVETLRCAIQYIKYLQGLLQEGNFDKDHNSKLKFTNNKMTFSSDYRSGAHADSVFVCSKNSLFPGNYEYDDSDYDVMNSSSDFTEASSDAESLK